MNVRALQFEIGNNCNNNCDFCYLKESRVISSPEQQIANIKKAKEIITREIKNYNAIGLIGGEFFQGQMNSTVKAEFFDLIKFICSQNIEQFGLTASLIGSNQDDLFETLEICSKPVLLCTSYDTMGRFHTAEQEERGFKNIARISGVTSHTQTIISQDFIDKVIEDSSFLQRIIQYSMIDFKFPTVFAADYYKIYGPSLSVSRFRELVSSSVSKFPDRWFISNRPKLFKCLDIITSICGPEKLLAIASNEARSDTFYHLSTGIIDSGRWNPNNKIENAPCGHPGDSYCYLNSDRCVRCDIINYYKEILCNYH